MNTVFGIKNILSDEECDLFISFINDNLDVFETYENENNEHRKALRFGIDDIYKTSHHDLSLIPGLHEILKKLFNNITTQVQEQTRGPKLYVTSFHMGKQLPGSRVDAHIDSDVDYNGHFKYSTVVYLNTVSSGPLVFPAKDISYQPRAGDLIVFPSIGKEWEHHVDKIDEDRYNLPIWLTEDPSWELSFFA